jgi:hypothetical protein
MACDVVVAGERTLCGSWVTGEGKTYCTPHEAEMNQRYPQGWRYYPGDVCRHGKYVGGCGVDLMCGACEMGDD